MDVKVNLSSDYLEGAHPRILARLLETNLEQTSGYGTDPYCESAKRKIREACGAPDAEIYFLTGGTQTNAIVIGALLRQWQGVAAAETGHISTHEAGAIEAGGHKVMTLPEKNGKISAEDLERLIKGYREDPNRDHMVMPGMVYLSQPTEYGTLYSRKELAEISSICRKSRIPLYVDGARLAYALACPQNDVSLADLAELCDVFYIGGTKCGALFGEAVVITDPGLLPHFFTVIKQKGALLAKGRMLGIQFDCLFTDNLYGRIGEQAVAYADRIRDMFSRKGIPLLYGSPTNQVFPLIPDAFMQQLAQKVEFSFWEKYSETETVIRLAASWATTEDSICRLENAIFE